MPRSSAWWLMEISLFVLSMSDTLSLWDKSRFFFKPVQVNLQLTDLAVKLGNQCLVVLFFSFSPVAEQIQQTLQDNRFPVPNLARMNLISWLASSADVFCSLIASKATLALNEGGYLLRIRSTWTSSFDIPSVTYHTVQILGSTIE